MLFWQKLYTNAGNFRAFKILIAAEYNGVDIQVPDFDLAKQGKSADFLAKSPAGKVPALETPQGECVSTLGGRPELCSCMQTMCVDRHHI